jgi:hypothetical protein
MSRSLSLGERQHVSPAMDLGVLDRPVTQWQVKTLAEFPNRRRSYWPVLASGFRVSTVEEPMPRRHETQPLLDCRGAWWIAPALRNPLAVKEVRGTAVGRQFGRKPLQRPAHR